MKLTRNKLKKWQCDRYYDNVLNCWRFSRPIKFFNFCWHFCSIAATLARHCLSTSAIRASQCANASDLAMATLSLHCFSICITLVSLVRRIFSSIWLAIFSPSFPVHFSFLRSSAFNDWSDSSGAWNNILLSSAQLHVPPGCRLHSYIA